VEGYIRMLAHIGCKTFDRWVIRAMVEQVKGRSPKSREEIEARLRERGVDVKAAYELAVRIKFGRPSPERRGGSGELTDAEINIRKACLAAVRKAVPDATEADIVEALEWVHQLPVTDPMLHDADQPERADNGVQYPVHTAALDSHQERVHRVLRALKDFDRVLRQGGARLQAGGAET
jgi:hypothetical protein